MLPILWVCAIRSVHVSIVNVLALCFKSGPANGCTCFICVVATSTCATTTFCAVAVMTLGVLC
jgi:hypothetical protein